MTGASNSLLSFLDAPVVVVDPDGRSVYVNPAFDARFCGGRGGGVGVPVASLFEGGGREAVLGAVVGVCGRGGTVRFRIREKGVGFVAVASPITAEGARVGVLVLLLEETFEAERLLALHREMHAPIDEVARCLEELVEQTGGHGSNDFRAQLEEGLRAVERLRKWMEEFDGAAAGHPSSAPGAGSFDPAEAVRNAAAPLVRGTAEHPCAVELLVPAQLPSVAGDGDRFSTALSGLLRYRLAHSAAKAVTLTAKAVGQGERAAVVVSIVETPNGEEPLSFVGEETAVEALPDPVAQAVRSLGASLRTTEDPVEGRTTAIRLPVQA